MKLTLILDAAPGTSDMPLELWFVTPGPTAPLRNRWFADSPLEERVSSEPVSTGRFPDVRENTGNLRRLSVRELGQPRNSAIVFSDLHPNSLTDRTGNFSPPSRE